jgi:asparagine synthase (glutamine-hydrolysing)
MAICGIGTTRESQPVDGWIIEAMVSALAPLKGWLSQRETGGEVALGATSPTNTACTLKSAEVIVACDADILNAAEIRTRSSVLMDAGPANVFAQLYLQDGPEFLKTLRGAFAIAIWDCRSKIMLLATDRFGVKPLCYSANRDAIVFASYPRGVLASARIEKKVDPTAIVNYLNFNAVPVPLSAFAGISKLPPATCLIWKGGETHTHRYWEMNYPEDAHATTQQLAEEMLERMEEAVRVSSADVSTSRIGCFLSGGTDSSSVVGLLTRVKNSSVNSISIGFDEERFNELEYAEIAAKHFRSKHTVAHLRPDDAFRIIPQIVRLYDEPFANSSVIPTYHCQTIARELGIEVMLAGDGGDELFGGNERYRTHQLYELYNKIPRLIRTGCIEPVLLQIPLEAHGIGGKVRRYVEVAKTPNPDRYFRWAMLQYFAPEDILGPALPFRNGHSDLLAIARRHYHTAPAKHEMNRLLYVDIKMTLGDSDLPKVARAAELAGVNVRFPFLDHPLTEFSGRLPASLKVKGLEKRYLFKRATSRLLPRPILAKRKHGFGLPVGLWLKTNPRMRGMAEDVLRDPRTYQRGYIQRQFVDNLFAAMDKDNTPFYGDVLWPFLMLELWHRCHVEDAP